MKALSYGQAADDPSAMFESGVVKFRRVYDDAKGFLAVARPFAQLYIGILLDVLRFTHWKLILRFGLGGAARDIR